MPLAEHIEFLTRFAQSHLTGDESRDGMLRLKLDHSLRVFSNAERIIEGEKPNATISATARLAALYHDIGRFPQFARYATFNDRQSVNHGRLGVITLRNTDLPALLPDATWSSVRLAVGLHNVKSLRDSLKEPIATVTKLVRDADKLDILKIMVEHFSGEHPDQAITHDVPDRPEEYSQRIYDTVLAKRPGDYQHIRCVNDFKILIIGWVYDLNFKTSISLLRERELIDRIFSYLPENKEIEHLKKTISSFIQNPHPA